MFFRKNNRYSTQVTEYMFYFNPVDSACKSVVGAVREGTQLKIKVFTDLRSVTLYVVADVDGTEKAYPMKKTAGGFFAYLDLPVGIYWYHFATPLTRYGRGDDLKAKKNSPDNFQLTVYKKDYEVPNLLKGGIVYQIFPDRFKKTGDFEVGKGKVKRSDWGGEPTYRDADGEVKNNEFFGGNFDGIRSELSYLKKLGVTVIYLNPISKAYSSHRYDTGDYMTVDPVLGDDESLKRLIAEAKKKGISLVFDGVYNHTGADSVYFNKYRTYPSVGAYNDKSSEYYDWFDFYDHPDGYASWWGFESLPSIVKDSESYQKFICEVVLPKYFSMGFKGVRLDVVDELTDDFVKAIKKTVTSFSPDNAVIGEVWEDATNKLAYGVRKKYFQGEELDSVMNYPLREAVISYMINGDTRWLVKTFNEQINNYSKPVLDNLMNVLSTHDTPRLITVLGRNRVVLNKDLLKYEKLDKDQYERGKTLAKLAYTIVFTCYGTPSVYYGDEAGLTGDLDPYNRRCYPWGNEDEDMLSYMTYLAKLRQKSAAIRKGSFKLKYYDKEVLVYLRQYLKESVLVAISRNPTEVKIKLDRNYTVFGGEKSGKEFTLQPDSALVLIAEKS